MLVLLVACGAMAVFAAGWAAALAFRHDADLVPTPSTVPVRVDSLHAEVLERLATGVVVAGRTGTIEYRNRAASSLDGTHVGVLVDEAVARHLATARAGTASDETLELYGPPKRVVVVASQPLPSGRSVAFIDDISDRRRSDQARTDFVANVSHELRTPIGALMVLAETIVGERDPGVIERVVTRMQGEAERAANTIDDLLELSQIEATIERDFQPVRLTDVVDDAVGRVGELAAARQITISRGDPSATDAGREVVVRGDRRQLSSAVGNMVENAVKYSDAGDVVTVLVRCRDGAAEIVVADEGAGIPRRDIDRVFERFYRVDRARSRTTGGTGLGLSIVRHVAGNHGGTIEVESIEGEGSTFVLRLPSAPVPATPSTAAADDRAPDRPGDRGDDHQDTHEVGRPQDPSDVQHHHTNDHANDHEGVA